MHGCICVYMHIQTHARTQIRGESAPLQMLIVLRCVVRVLPSIGWDYFGFLGMRCTVVRVAGFHATEEPECTVLACSLNLNPVKLSIRLGKARVEGRRNSNPELKTVGDMTRQSTNSSLKVYSGLAASLSRAETCPEVGASYSRT